MSREIKLTNEQLNLLEQSIQDAMQTELTTPEMMEKADVHALSQVRDLFQPVVQSVAPEYYGLHRVCALTPDIKSNQKAAFVIYQSGFLIYSTILSNGSSLFSCASPSARSCGLLRLPRALFSAPCVSSASVCDSICV
ncbi:MAG: hypothetical protein R2912_09990 [Eubacteriales bacterium]